MFGRANQGPILRDLVGRRVDLSLHVVRDTRRPPQWAKRGRGGRSLENIHLRTQCDFLLLPKFLMLKSAAALLGHITAEPGTSLAPRLVALAIGVSSNGHCLRVPNFRRCLQQGEGIGLAGLGGAANIKQSLGVPRTKLLT